LFTAVATVGVGIQAMFFSSYEIDGFEGKDHIFTSIQKDTSRWIDHHIYGIDPGSIQETLTSKDDEKDSTTTSMRQNLGRSNRQ
jgi:hypothetical protein